MLRMANIGSLSRLAGRAGQGALENGQIGCKASGTEPFLQGPVAENYASWSLRFSVDGTWSPSGFHISLSVLNEYTCRTFDTGPTD